MAGSVAVSSNPGAESRRYHELDALRAFAMLLGVVLHASLFLIPLPDFWPVQDSWISSVAPEANPYGYLMLAIHGFRMPLFFLLSGFFTALLWQRRGLRELAEHRVKRIGLPLAVGAFTIIPILAWIFTAGDFAPIDWPLAWLHSFFHLWFLWLLLFLAAGFIIATRLGAQWNSRLWWLAIPLVTLPQLLMDEQILGPDTSDSLVPDPVVLGYYALFFGFGAFFYRSNIRVRQWWAAALAPSLTVVFFGAAAQLYRAEGKAAWVGASILEASYAWLMCFGMMGLFLWIAGRERIWIRYLSDASYWIYLWHLPLVLAGQWLAAGWRVSVHLKFALICLAVTGILLALYQLGVRYTPVGTMLNGRRRRPTAAQPTGANASQD